jgi:hypothetical protein
VKKEVVLTGKEDSKGQGLTGYSKQCFYEVFSRRTRAGVYSIVATLERAAAMHQRAPCQMKHSCDTGLLRLTPTGMYPALDAWHPVPLAFKELPNVL